MSGRGTIGYVSGSATEQIYTYAPEPIPTLVEFTTTGANSYTVPAGVTYIVANIIGGGGGVATNVGTNAQDGTASSVAFAAGTKTAAGGKHFSTTVAGTAASVGTGNRWGAGACAFQAGVNKFLKGSNGTYLRTGGEVTPGATLTVTVGAGGAAGTNGAAGKQGYVSFELYSGNKRRVESFQASGTFNPASGVTTVHAFIRGAGGSSNVDGVGTSAGGSSSVAFTAGTKTALGGAPRVSFRGAGPAINGGISGADNSGDGSFSSADGSGYSSFAEGERGQEMTVQGTVAFGTGVTVTIGAGVTYTGTSGSGLVWIEYNLP
jgi:hypothetical protein